MSTHRCTGKIGDQPIFDKPIDFTKTEVGGAWKYLSPLEYHTDQQRRWFKGILLKKLSEDNGDTVRQWETELIMNIFPEDVRYVAVNKQVFPVVPSITAYGKKKMNQLIEESVAYCQKAGFTWVTLPDKELRA